MALLPLLSQPLVSQGAARAVEATNSAPLTTPTPAPTPDPLGLWLTTVDSRVMEDQAERSRALTFLGRHGFSRVALPIMTGGLLYWPANQASNRLGVPLAPTPPLRPFIDALHTRGLRVVGWFEFGLMAPAEAPWLQPWQRHLLQDSQGRTRWTESPGLDRVWLNPAIPEVREALVALVLDACRQLPFDLIQFDDHLGYPAQFGYDPVTLGLWRQTPTGRLRPSPDPADPAWVAWRADRVTDLVRELRVAMERQCPSTRLSIAPNPQAFSYSHYLADWSHWVRQGLVDEVVVQVYRPNLPALQKELDQPELAEASQRLPVRIGLLAGLRSTPMDRQLFRQQVALLRQRGVAGIDVFFYESARLQFPLDAEVPMPPGPPLKSAAGKPPRWNGPPSVPPGGN
jgi:uncharacterized lipoprotein YddW (UPF0748 family)